MTGLICIKKDVGFQAIRAANFPPQQNEAADLDCRGEAALSLCSSISYLVVGVFFMTKMRFQIVGNNGERLTRGSRIQMDVLRRKSWFILKMGLRICGAVFQGVCGYLVA